MLTIPVALLTSGNADGNLWFVDIFLILAMGDFHCHRMGFVGDSAFEMD